MTSRPVIRFSGRLRPSRWTRQGTRTPVIDGPWTGPKTPWARGDILLARTSCRLVLPTIALCRGPRWKAHVTFGPG